MADASVTGRGVDAASMGICVAAVATDLLCRFFPARLPYVFPFIFNAPVFLGVWFALLWYSRGLKRMAAEQLPGRGRRHRALRGPARRRLLRGLPLPVPPPSAN